MVSNESNRDLSNFELNIGCDVDSAIIISYGRSRASMNELLFTDKYAALLINQKPENLPFIFQRRDYKLPVLNRGNKVDVSLLTTNFKDTQPIITVSCDYPGVKMKYATVFPELFGEPQIHSTLLGILATVLLCIPIICFIQNKLIAILSTAFIGLFASFIGAMLIKCYKSIIKILS